MPETTKSIFGWFLYHLTCFGTKIGFATKQVGHLHPQRQAPRTESLLAAYLQITCLAMIKHFVGIFLLLLREVMLPTVISHHTIRDVTFHLYPTIEYRQGPIIRQGKANLRNRARIDAQRLAAT